MIKLIASDLDGTLLPTTGSVLSERLFAQIRELTAQGIFFCAASGRQQHSLQHLFAPVAQEISYVCENGAVVYHGGQVIAKTLLAPADVTRILAQIAAQPNCEPVVSGLDGNYILSEDPALVECLVVHHNKFTVVENEAALPSEIVKISVYCKDGADKYSEIFAAGWENHLHVAISGKEWIDYTLANKGVGLAHLAETCGVTAEETLVFGDNFNDIEMFQFAGTAYVMENANPAVRQHATLRCSNVEDILQERFGLSQ